MVYGDTRQETRERLMLAFNSPLFPEILVSSAVLGEGVDLHRFCRHVIHHDLCWNPSTIEQRTGRLDRIRCKAEVTRHPIEIFEPYLAGSADERMFRVVRDRERWFQIVMGQKFEFDEKTAEETAARVMLSYRTNRIIGGVAPSKYLQKLEVGRTTTGGQLVEPPIPPAVLDGYLVSHCIPVGVLRANDFHGFIAGRQQALLELVSKVTGHPVPTVAQPAEEGEELSPALAHDTGFELVEAE
jgi:Helicase conserved C-terminal domain